MNKENFRYAITGFIVLLWGIGAITAVFDGNTLLQVTTPMMTLALGYVFAKQVTTNGSSDK